MIDQPIRIISASGSSTFDCRLNNITQGRIWVLVPIVTAMAPWLMAKARGLIA